MEWEIIYRPSYHLTFLLARIWVEMWSRKLQKAKILHNFFLKPLAWRILLLQIHLLLLCDDAAILSFLLHFAINFSICGSCCVWKIQINAKYRDEWYKFIWSKTSQFPHNISFVKSINTLNIVFYKQNEWNLHKIRSLGLHHVSVKVHSISNTIKFLALTSCAIFHNTILRYFLFSI